MHVSPCVQLLRAVVYAAEAAGMAGATGGVEPFYADALVEEGGGDRGSGGYDGADAFVAGDRGVGAHAFDCAAVGVAWGQR